MRACACGGMYVRVFVESFRSLTHRCVKETRRRPHEGRRGREGKERKKEEYRSRKRGRGGEREGGKEKKRKIRGRIWKICRYVRYSWYQIILDSSSFLTSSLRCFYLQLLRSLFLLLRRVRFFSLSPLFSLFPCALYLSVPLILFSSLSPFLLVLIYCYFSDDYHLSPFFPPSRHLHDSFSFPLSLSRSLSRARLKDDLVTSLYYSNTSVNILCTGGALPREESI